MIKNLIALIVVSVAGGGSLILSEAKLPAEKPSTMTKINARSETSYKLSYDGNDLSRFQNVGWGINKPSPLNRQEVFDLFTPFIPDISRRIPESQTFQASNNSSAIMQGVPNVVPFRSFAKFVTEGDNTGVAAGTYANLRGVNTLGNAQITNTNSSIRASWFGSPLDKNGLTEYIGGSGGIQDIIARGGTGLAMGWTQFNNLPSNFRLSPNDPLVTERVINQGYQPGAIGLLNPQSPYIAIKDGKVPTGTRIIVTNDRTGYQEIAIKVDAGPGNSTDKGIDMSPGLYQRMNGDNDTFSYAIASDQNVPPGPTDGTAIPYDQPIVGLGGTSSGGAYGQSGGSGNTSFCGNGVWNSDPTCCYKHTGPAGAPNQYDGVGTCNAGYIMAGKVPKLIPDCGPMGGLCNKELSLSVGGPKLSCLITACALGKNAIWDPVTHRCGCDDGLGGSLFANEANFTGDTTPNYDETGESYYGGDVGQGTPGQIGQNSGKVTFAQSNDRIGFQTGYILRDDGVLVPVSQSIYNDLDELGANGHSPYVTSMVGHHDQNVSGSTNQSRHWTANAYDLKNDRAQVEYLYNNRVRLGIRQIITGAYPEFNFDASGRTFSSGLLRSHNGHMHIGH